MRKDGRYIPCSDYWRMNYELVTQGICFDPHEGSIQRLYMINKLQSKLFFIVIF